MFIHWEPIRNDVFYNETTGAGHHSSCPLQIVEHIYLMTPLLMPFTTPPLNHNVSKKGGRRHGGGALKIRRPPLAVRACMRRLVQASALASASIAFTSAAHAADPCQRSLSELQKVLNLVNKFSLFLVLFRLILS